MYYLQTQESPQFRAYVTDAPGAEIMGYKGDPGLAGEFFFTKVPGKEGYFYMSTRAYPDLFLYINQ